MQDNRSARLHLPLRWCMLLFGCIACLAAGCAGLHVEIMQEVNLPPRMELDAVPFYPQKAYQCGPAALAMALKQSGIAIHPDDLTAEVYTPARKGSLQSALIGATRRHGRIAYKLSGMKALLREVAAGHAVIVLQNLGLFWYPVWHYAVVVGYDLPQRTVTLHSGVTARKQMSLRIFEKTWARSGCWGLIVLPPDEMPATAQKEAFLAAVLGLERARQWPAAVHGYQSALTRWPESLSALMGLGNSHYAVGNLKNAEAAFRQAVQRHPQAAAAFNNLAQILSEKGQKREALEAAQKAVALGGALSDAYRKTLEEIQKEKGK